jgi:hypothetical protein
MRNVLVPADKACNNIVFVCKVHYYQCIINELDINSAIGNRTYTPTTFSKDEILQNQASVFNVPGHVVDDYELPYLYWIPKLHTKILCWFQKMFYKTFVNTPYQNVNSCEGEASNVLCQCICQNNQMWILKNSKELLASLKSSIFSQIYSIKTYDITILYTTKPHDKLKTRLFGIIDSCFLPKIVKGNTHI